MSYPSCRALLIVAVLAGSCSADQIDDIVRAEMTEQHIPGLAIAVMKDGHVIRTRGYGLANVELNVPVTPRTVFKIGSVSKQFLASAVLILAQEGKLRLDDPVRRFLSDAPPTWDGITLNRLLSHTAGLVSEGPAFAPLLVQPDIQVIQSAYPAQLLFQPGDRWQYSNLGYFTAAEIISRVTGSAWPDFVATQIFRPLRMTASRTASPQDIIPKRADGYEWKDGKLQRAEEYLALRPSGAFLSTVEDLAKWDAALYTDAPLTRASRDEMWTPVKLNDGSSSAYGLGWEVQIRAGHRSIHHSGALPGFRAHIARFPDDHLSFVVLDNSSPSRPDRVLWRIAACWLPGVQSEPPNGRKPRP